VIVALLFVTLPFVVRSVQPVLIELDREVDPLAHLAGGFGRRRLAAAHGVERVQQAVEAGGKQLLTKGGIAARTRQIVFADQIAHQNLDR
jgi:hypothetical protein